MKKNILYLKNNKIDDFIGREFPQNCGDILKVIKKSEKRSKNGISLYECEFIKYPKKILAQRGHIIRGNIKNPLIEIEEFINKIWLQNCGDSLRIIEKSKKADNKGEYLWECEFIKYPYKVLTYKNKILKGCVNNPLIEKNEFIGQEFLQHCGDILKVIKKTNKKQNNISLYKCKFVNYPYELLTQKSHVLEGTVLNPKIPWINKEENQVRDFIKSLYNGKVVKYSGKKEDNYYEIDIYLPELKKGIEYNGSPWHEEGNPNNKFSKPIGYHQKKQEIFAKKGIDILFVWDYEWFEDFPRNKIVNKQTKQRIREFLKI